MRRKETRRRQGRKEEKGGKRYKVAFDVDELSLACQGDYLSKCRCF